jgi:tRNA dimethylallyltransferase
MQVYRGFDIGTAKATVSEQARIPHHGIDLVEPSHRFSAGAFLEYARGVLESRRPTPVLAVGGTGLYLRAMLHGLGPRVRADVPRREEMREAEQGSPGWMHRRLAQVDSEASARIHPHDLIRLERALEVFEQTGETLSAWHARHRFAEAPFEVLQISIRRDRDPLRERIARRVERMLERGLIDEVRGLLAAGVPRSATPMRAIGYPQVVRYLDGELDRASLGSEITTATRRFAKRQTTWFNRDPSIEWVDPGADLAPRLLPRVQHFLAGAD